MSYNQVAQKEGRRRGNAPTHDTRECAPMPPHSTCSVEGCDRPRWARGWCNSHYARWIRYGDIRLDDAVQTPERPTVCSIPECDGVHYARGWCRLHYGRWRKRGSASAPVSPRLRRPPFERFMAKVDVHGPNGCWLWTGAPTAGGYGHFTLVKGTSVYSHRFAYERHHGPIADGLVIDHLCRNPPCVNVEHLEAVTQRENVLRGNAPAAQNAAKTHCKRGHEFTAENTGRDRSGRQRQCRACRAERVALVD